MKPVLIVCSLLFLTVAPAWSQAPVSKETSETLKDWQERLRDYGELLKQQKYSKANSRINRLLKEMCDRIEGGPGAAPILSLAVLLRAVSEAGMGHERDAIWDLEMSYTLHEDMRDADLSGFGKPGQFLAEAVRPKPESATQRRDIPEGAAITAPVKVREKPPKYPFAQREACIEGPIVTMTVIDEQGIPQHPQLISERYPVLGFAALDSLRGWKFKPALYEGEPVEVYYRLQVNFKIPICRNPFAVKEQLEDSR